MDEKAYKESMVYLESLWGHELSPMRVRQYYQILRMIPDDRWPGVVERVIQTFRPYRGHEFPAPSVFLDCAGLTTDDRVANGMLILKRAVPRIGQYESVDFKDLALHAVVESYGGWPLICTWSEKDWAYNARAFKEAYASAIKGGKVGPEVLLGIAAAENLKNGYRKHLGHVYEIPIDSSGDTVRQIPLASKIDSLQLEHKGASPVPPEELAATLRLITEKMTMGGEDDDAGE